MKAQAKKLGCFVTICSHVYIHSNGSPIQRSRMLLFPRDTITLRSVPWQHLRTRVFGLKPFPGKPSEISETNHLGFCTRVKRCCAPFQPLEHFSLKFRQLSWMGFAGKCIKLLYCQKVHSVLFPKVQNEKLHTLSQVGGVQCSKSYPVARWKLRHHSQAQHKAEWNSRHSGRVSLRVPEQVAGASTRPRSHQARRTNSNQHPSSLHWNTRLIQAHTNLK